MKKMISFMMMLGLVGFTLMLGACTSSNVYTYVIDESYTEYITMGTSADYPPYEWPKNVDGKQTLVGIDIEIAKHIAKALGKNLKIVNKSFDFLLDDLQSGKVDFVIAGMTPTEDRAKKVDFSIIYYEAQQVVLVSQASVGSYTSIESLNLQTIRVGAQMGSIQKDLVDEFFPNAQKMILQSIPDLILKVQQGQIDALVVEKPVADGYIQHLTGLVLAPFSIGEPDGGSAVAVSKGNADLLAVINQVLEDLISTGKLDEIIQAMTELNTPE